jgi:hypothetical protein
MNGKQSTWFKWTIWACAIGLAVVVPTTTYAWFCGATGRMTGGGKLVSLLSVVGQVDVTSPTTNGYELHCTEKRSNSNNLEINSHDPNGFHFHLDDLQTANCYTTNGGQNPPTADFDTFAGVGAGTWSNGNTKIDACAEWIFIDGQGIPQNNSSYIRVTDQPPLDTTDLCEANPPTSNIGVCPGNTVLLVPAQTPLNGQNQAHK